MRTPVKTLELAPVRGRSVHYPFESGRLLPEEGAPVPCTTYWLRRLAAGDVVRVTKTRSPSQTKPAEEERAAKRSSK